MITLNHSWKAYRFQPHVIIDEEELAAQKAAKAAAFRKTLHTPVADDDDNKAGAKKTPTSTPTKNIFSTPAWGSPFGQQSASPMASPSNLLEKKAAEADLEELIKLRDLSIAPPKPKASTPSKTSLPLDSASSSSTTTTPTQQPSASDHRSSQQEKTISKATAAVVASTTQTHFIESYIEFDKEPEIASYSGEYDTDYTKKANEGLSEGSEGTWAGEGYESGVAARDKPFHRFHKRLQRAPEQCLRYWRGAEPLFSSADKPKAVPQCANCGAPRVPEMQLTPALIYLLKPSEPKQESNLEFGTVIMYTCVANCTSPSRPLFLEHVILQKGM